MQIGLSEPREEEEAEGVGEEVSVVAALDHYCIAVALDYDSEEQPEVGALAALAVDEAAAAEG